MRSKIAAVAVALVLLVSAGCGAEDPRPAAPPDSVDTVTLYSYGTQIGQYQARHSTIYSRVTWIVFTTTDGRDVTWAGAYLIVGAAR